MALEPAALPRLFALERADVPISAPLFQNDITLEPLLVLLQVLSCRRDNISGVSDIPFGEIGGIENAASLSRHCPFFPQFRSSFDLSP